MPKERNKAESYREKAPIKREKSDACIDSSEREAARRNVKVQKTSQRVDDITKTADYKAAMDDVKHGRVTEYDSVEDLFEKLGVAL